MTGRHKFLIFTFVLVGVVLMARMFWLAIVESEFLQARGAEYTERVVPIPTNRGVIYDRRGTPLSLSTPVTTIWTDPNFDVIDKESYEALAQALRISKTRLEEILESAAGKQYVRLARRVSHEIADDVKKLNLDGVRFAREYRRYYPAGEVTSQVVGITDPQGKGLEGLELAQDRRLAGSPGERKILLDGDKKRRRIRDLGLEPPIFGEDIFLTLDLGLQYLTFASLEDAVDEFDAESATAIVIDASNGEILALANYPSYNPNDPRDRKFSKMRNLALTDAYEPGSTIKPFVALAALESARYSRDTTIDTRPGYFRVGRDLVEDPRDYGVLSLEMVLVKSSQVGISKIALDLEKLAVLDMIERAGMTDVPLSGLPGETMGSINIDELERDIGRATMAYGYGLRVSPLQLARAYLTLASGGILKRLTILRNEEERYGDVRVFDQEYVKTVVEMLEGVVSPIGTASKGRIEGFAVAGKTGTVRKYSVGGYDDTRHLAWFCGMVPSSDPRIVAVVMINEPKGLVISGGGVASPIFAEIASHALQLMGLTDSSQQTSGQANAA